MRARAPRWQSRRQAVGSPFPPGLPDWLFEEGSLTRRLVARCGQRFSLRLVSSSRGPALPDERRALALPLGCAALVRQVYLLCGDRPLVFARSVMPPGSLRGPNGRLARLGSRPLAVLLIGPVPAARGAIEVAPVGPGQALFEAAGRGLECAPAAPLWARRSIFYPRGKPVLVTEVFLPGVAELP